MNKRLYAKKVIPVIAFIVLFLIAFLFIKAKINIKERNISKAEEYFYTFKMDDAIKTYEIIENKDNALWPAKISEVYLLKEDFSNADIYINKALKKNDVNGEAHSIILNNKFKILKSKIGTGEFKNDEVNELLEVGEKYLEEYPENENIQKLMFSIYVINNNNKSKMIVDNYSEETAYNLCEKASMKFILNDFQSGIELLNTAFQKDKNEIKIYETLYNCYKGNNEILDLVLSKYENDKENSCYKLMLAKIYLKNNDFEKAYELINSVKKDDDFIIPEVLKLNLEEIKGEKLKAKEICQNLLKKQPKNYLINSLMASIYIKNDDLENASKYFSKSVSENKKYINNYIHLATNILERKGEPDKAIPYLHYATYLEPYNSDIYIKSGEYGWYNLNNAVKALENLKVASMIDSNNIELKYKISKLYLENHNYEEAIKFLKECITNDESNSEYHRTLGTTYIILNKNEEALKEIDRAYAIDNKDVLTINNLGCYYIIVESNIMKAKEKFTNALNSLKDSDDDYTKKTVKDNYDKIMKLKEKYDTGKENEVIKIPDFIMFY